MRAQSAPTAGKALLGVGALVGGALLIFQEIDTALEVAGIFAAGQFALRRLLFAEDRKKTQAEIKCARRPHACASDLACARLASVCKLHCVARRFASAGAGRGPALLPASGSRTLCTGCAAITGCKLRCLAGCALSKCHAQTRRELVDEKIAVKDVPKDLRKLADKVRLPCQRPVFHEGKGSATGGVSVRYL